MGKPAGDVDGEGLRSDGRPSGTIATGPVRVLAIDDDAALLRAVKRALGGCEVVTYTEAREALALLAGGARFDVVLCDLMMPRMTGMEFVREVRALDRAQAQRIVVLSGGTYTSEAASFLEADAIDRLEKPFGMMDVRAVVERYTSRTEATTSETDPPR